MPHVGYEVEAVLIPVSVSLFTNTNRYVIRYFSNIQKVYIITMVVLTHYYMLQTQRKQANIGGGGGGGTDRGFKWIRRKDIFI